jgi:hypothetical protein
LVNLVEDWKIVEEYADDKIGFYQVLGDDEPVEIRVSVGRCGFKKEFQNKTDPLLIRILAFCRLQKYVRISESIRDDSFFK